MGVSLKFKFIESYLNELLKAIALNKNIAKYIYYNKSNDPLSMPDVTINLIEEGYCFPNYFDGEPVEDERIRVFLNIMGSPLSEPIDTVTFLLEIVMPDKYYTLHGRGENRAIRIMDEVAKTVDQQLGIGVGETTLKNLRVTRPQNMKYHVASVNIMVKNPTTTSTRHR